MSAAYMPKAKSDLWQTPRQLFAELDSEFHFTLDACAFPETSKCKRYFSQQENALIQEWDKSTFCNPPYGPPLEKWLHKAWLESKRGCTVVMLLPARTDTRWFHRFCLLNCAEIRWLKGRLHFGDLKDPAPFPSMIVIFRPEESNSSGRSKL